MPRLDAYVDTLDRDRANARFLAKTALSMIGSPPLGGSLLDIGCGRGELLELAVAAGMDPVAGVERPRVAAHKGARGAFRIEHIDLEATPLPFDNDSFDVVTCLEVLEHLYDPLRALAEAARVLRPGGRLVVSVPNQFHLATRIRMLAGRNISDPLRVGGHIKFFRVPDLLELCGRLSLDDVVIRGIAYPTAYRRYGPFIRLLLNARPSLFATWFFASATKRPTNAHRLSV